MYYFDSTVNVNTEVSNRQLTVFAQTNVEQRPVVKILLISMEIDHSHCNSCFKRFCSLLQYCEIINCKIGCGARFHSCKQEELRMLCEEELVQCINSLYGKFYCKKPVVSNLYKLIFLFTYWLAGCPMKMRRCSLKNHLKNCPASVIFCNKEWNRWPNHCPEKLVRVPFTENKFKAKYGQLDVALALRDQKVLEQGLKVPRRLR